MSRGTPAFVPSGVVPRLDPLKGIRAIVFDVYGTLLLGGGPVMAHEKADEELRVFLRQCGIVSEEPFTLRLEEAVREFHQASQATHPEVDLFDLWERVLNRAISKELFAALESIRQTIIPMPELRETIVRLRLPLGLISNAQRDTPALLKKHIGFDAFEKDLCILSWQIGESKPSPILFNRLASALTARNLDPGTVAVVGNDPHHDIIPAKARGFRTILAAIDRDSLRRGDPAAADAVISHLSQLPSLLDH